MPPSEAERATALEWLRRARGNLARARQPKPVEAYWEDLCFDAQQAAEKAVKAVPLWQDVEVPYVHDIDALLERLERAGHPVPAGIREVDDLSRYAVETRYPGIGTPISADEYRSAVALAERVLEWAEAILASSRPADP
jgi:HEPN domain-containing protein